MPHFAEQSSTARVGGTGPVSVVEQALTRVPAQRLTSTVPREYVHRAAVSEVFLTGWDAVDPQAGSEKFVVRAQWPRSHSLFARDDEYQDPLLLVESVRQVGSLLAHAEFDVPFGHQFLMRDMSVSLEPELLRAGRTPTEIVLRTECRDIVRRNGALSSMGYVVTVERDGRSLGTAEASFRCMSPQVFRRLRGGTPTHSDRPVPPAVEPALVGHTSPRHVVLGVPAPGTDGRWELRVDTAHPTYFDHPVDHVPGMVLLEAARQAAHAVSGLPDALVLGLRSTFTCYAEFEAPCWIEARTVPGEGGDGMLVRVEGTQRDKQVFTTDLVVAPRTR
ncbi:ScbA/BarX family gamma-butyrolactone biosynthesis protein [Streptomyces roseolus]|uniref:ScbA/BarX family gamma-butyrolactone biosynthesis protein n=1 Tax=Streptomyces roseolus TaxID=67358 RepID=UPI001672662D|nr:ScbA/BarX family gamma-butyrolactone biosynthesis protein [Streptomyces roseolus]GGR68446.1 adhesin [Streptomyces roseolus]